MNKIFKVCLITSVLISALFATAQVAENHGRALDRNASSSAAVTSDALSQPISSAAAKEEFVIGVGDVLAVNVWKEADISRAVPVRSDGRITLPLLGEIPARGLTAKQLEKEISGKLGEFVSDPVVTVIVQEIHSQNFNILGQVQHPGTFPLTHPVTVLDAIALSGGFRDFAKTKAIYVLRQKPDGTWARLPFNYKEAVKGTSPAQNLRIENGDTLFVP